MAPVLSPATLESEVIATARTPRQRIFWIALLCVLASRICLLFFGQWLPGDDGLRYLQEAQNLVHYGVFSHLVPPYPSPTMHDLPLFPFLFSVFLRIVPEPASAMRVMSVCNAVFFTVAAAAIFRLTELLCRNVSTAVIAIALFAACPESLPYSLFSMPESLFLMFFLWAVFLLASFFETGKTQRFIAGFALLGFSVLTKPASLFFAAVVIVWALCFWPCKQQPFRLRLLSIGLGLLVEFATISPWIVRNQVTLGSPTLTTITGTNLFNDNYLILLTDQHGADAEAIQRRQLEGLHWSGPVQEANLKGAIAKRELLAHWRDYVKTNIKHHPRLYLGTGALALLRLLGDSSGVAALEEWQRHPALSTARLLPAPVLILQLTSWLFLGILYAAALVGALMFFNRRSWFALSFTIIPLVYFAAIIGPVVYTRYRLPMDPFFAVLAANCFYRIKTYVLV